MGKKKPQWDASYVLKAFTLGADLRHQLELDEANRQRCIGRERDRAENLYRAQWKANEVANAAKKAAKEKAVENAEMTQFPAPADGLHLRAWDPEHLRLLEISAPNRFTERDELARAKKVSARMREAGPWRRVVKLPEDWRVRLEILKARFPNFESVLEYIAASCAFAERQDGAVGFGPVLLSGPPGIGKTMIVNEVAAALGLPLHRIDMASAQCGARLSGSEEYWSNSKPGMLFDILALGEAGAPANSMVLLDELEKADRGERSSPTGGLYSILEPMSARTFTDLAFPQLVLDASRLVFIAVANEPERIAPPILSRLRHFRIPTPTPSQGRGIVERMNADVAAALQLDPGPLTDEILDRLARGSPRAVRQMLHEAYGRALVAGRTVLEPGDLQALAPVGVIQAARSTRVILISSFASETETDKTPSEKLH